jgi:hypothetical protein
MREIDLADRRVEAAIRQMDRVEEAEKALIISTDSDYFAG